MNIWDKFSKNIWCLTLSMGCIKVPPIIFFLVNTPIHFYMYAKRKGSGSEYEFYSQETVSLTWSMGNQEALICWKITGLRIPVFKHLLSAVFYTSHHVSLIRHETKCWNDKLSTWLGLDCCVLMMVQLLLSWLWTKFSRKKGNTSIVRERLNPSWVRLIHLS